MFKPFAQIESLLSTVSLQPAAAEDMRAMMQRGSEFPSLFAAKLTCIALDANGCDAADRFLNTYWADELRQQNALRTSGTGREVIIGSGFHAATYAAVCVRGCHLTASGAAPAL